MLPVRRSIGLCGKTIYLVLRSRPRLPAQVVKVVAYVYVVAIITGCHLYRSSTIVRTFCEQSYDWWTNAASSVENLRPQTRHRYPAGSSSIFSLAFIRSQPADLVLRG